jgi:hypothetical protein
MQQSLELAFESEHRARDHARSSSRSLNSRRAPSPDHRAAWSPARTGVPPPEEFTRESRLLTQGELLIFKQARNQRSNFLVR